MLRSLSMRPAEITDDRDMCSYFSYFCSVGLRYIYLGECNDDAP